MVESPKTPGDMPTRLAPTAVRYIKLGAGNAWFESCRRHDRLELGHPDITHEAALTADWDALVENLVSERGRTAAKARDFVRELRDFYTLDAECLWVTFADGCLWWACSEPTVTWLGGDGETSGYRARPTIGPWRNTNIKGEVLRQSDLSTKLTQVAAYRQTLCSVQDADYLVRKINAEVEPIVAKAKEAERALITVASEMIASLHWRDFELLVDLIFAHCGWRRISEVGGNLKDIDLALEQPATGERAFVQVKSKADHGVLRDYMDRFHRDKTYDRMFFVCHSPIGDFDSSEDETVNVWSGDRLAQMTVKAGLFDWIVDRVG